MTKYRIPIDSYIVIEADTPDEAKREVAARQEHLAFLIAENKYNPIKYGMNCENDLLLNATIGEPSVEERDEYDEKQD